MIAHPIICVFCEPYQEALFVYGGFILVGICTEHGVESCSVSGSVHIAIAIFASDGGDAGKPYTGLPFAAICTSCAVESLYFIAVASADFALGYWPVIFW